MSRHRTTRWPKEFDARRTPKYKHGARYVDLRIGIGSGSSDLICTFMEDDNYTYAFDEADRVMEFTNGTGLRVQELQEAIGEPGTRQSVWIDDRLCPEPGDPGELLVSQPLQTPTFLYRHLIAKTEALLKDRASRRLIYVSDLDSWEVLSLAATAMWHEAPALRLAISNYFGFQPAIEAKVPSMGFTTFEFLLHLPFFILREKETNGYATRMGGRCGPPRERIDLSFLKMKPPGAKKTWALYQTNFSCAVTGTSDWDWVAYGFGDSLFDGHLHELDPEELENMDQLTSRERPTGYPIGWPRQYWLTVFETRARLSGREWRLVIKVLERQIKQYVRENTATMMRGITSEQDRRHLRGTMTWIVKAKDILQMVRDLLIEWIQAWDGFANSDIGGIDYFLDETSSPSHLDPLLEEIKLIFEGIRRLQGKLDSTRDHCDDYLKLLSLHLSISIESKEAAHPSASYLFSFSHFSAVLIHTLIAVILITWLSRSGENFRYGFPTPASHP